MLPSLPRRARLVQGEKDDGKVRRARTTTGTAGAERCRHDADKGFHAGPRWAGRAATAALRLPPGLEVHGGCRLGVSPIARLRAMI